MITDAITGQEVNIGQEDIVSVYVTKGNIP